ncbi:MAG: AAA family ATPase, partial [Synergistaceae bacterium]|nr:AAA family ATPase [Synergistaceae bacterium]
MTDIEEQVLDAMGELEVLPDGSQVPVIDGKIHRYRVRGDSPGSKNGFYMIHPDGWPAGVIGSWKHGGKVNWKYNAAGLDKSAQAELRKWERSPECKKLREEREKKYLQEQARAADEARARFEQAPEAQPDHPYFKRKNVGNYGLKQLGDDLLVPLYDEKGAFRSMQRINADPGRKKLFEAGCPAGGAFFPIAADVKTGPVLLCEGYSTGAALHETAGCTVICAMSCHNIIAVAPKIKKLFPNRKIFVAADNDHPGLTCAKEAVEKARLDGYFFPEFPEGASGTDWNDFAALAGMDEAAKAVSARIEWLCMSDDERKAEQTVQQINASDLMKLDMPEVRWAVPDFLPAGCSILSGGPKVGKSILALHLALAVATGGTALGCIEVERGDVAYMALEDTRRRLKTRIEDSGMPEDADLSRLTLVTRISRQHEGGLVWLEKWLKDHPDAKLVIIDTLQKFRKPHSGNGDRYGSDYDAISAIKSLSDKYDVTILIIHHTKKAKDEEDWLNEISGTQGIAGAADTLLFLTRGR